MEKHSPLKTILIVSAIFYLIFIIGTSFDIKGERYFTLVDDAMISMRYARNLAQGHGLVWNISEPPVEGFTNLGWTFYLAFLHLFPFPVSKISLAVMLTSLVILLANIHTISKIAEALQPDSKYTSTLAAIVTAFYFPLVFWSLRGMEVGLLTWLISLAILFSLTEKRPVFIGILFAAAILVRVDAIVSIAPIALYLLLKNKRNAIIPIAIAAIALLTVFYFQKIYFGDFLTAT